MTPSAKRNSASYQEIANSQRPGQALYGVKAARHSPEVDFVVWIEDVACFAIEVKGGNFWVENGTLFRQGPIGPEQVANPLRKAMDGALSISNSIKDRLPGGAFVISVLLFPDMEVEDDIRRWAQDSRTNVMFGITDLVRRLTELEDVQHIRHPPLGPPYRAGGRGSDARGAAGGQSSRPAQGFTHGPPGPARGDPQPGDKPLRHPVAGCGPPAWAGDAR